jgi:predicted NBD/HSP70 family sugar kinase
MLGVAVANLINIFDPSHVLFSGESLEAGEYLLTPMREAIREEAFGGLRESILVDPESGEDIPWVRGATNVMLDEIFRVPRCDTDQPLPIDEFLAAKKRVRRTKAP